MRKPPNDAGTIQVVLDRLNNQRLPRTLALKTKVDKGHALDDYDILYLKMVLEDGREALALANKYPEFNSLVSRLIDLYGEITRKGLENEEKS
jgi:hypothetical protein